MTNQPKEAAQWKRKIAVALRYRREQDAAPQVVAGGWGAVADRILETAKEHAIPVHEDAALACSLGKVGLGDPVPPELYQAVAEVIAFVYRLHPAGKTP
ncbi:MAG TPA: EscU/YscU/HrcU family type III secretion system export apparatus switch protein [Fibrobacteria bacterium]|nr:EscU/YscU/HrcU family type III secretion system export apparatus switch protein [Fibrobacteria bacterium]